MKNVILIIFIVFGINTAKAQQSSIVKLDEVVVSDSRLEGFSNGIKISVLKDSILQKNKVSLTNSLLYNSHLYFKENGAGMVSSPSFRGTGASQTAVIWNGININSPLNGQVDFNTILSQGFDKISIRSGGGSTQYGSGAIGGSIHLENILDFNTSWINNLSLGYGSFNTRNLSYKTKYGNKETALNIGINHLDSDNNYKYLGTDRKNENGSFANTAIDIGYGFLITPKNLIKIHHNTFIGNRDFSGSLTAPSNSKYQNLNHKTLIEWVNFKDNRVQHIKTAFLQEAYKYFSNKDKDEFTLGKAKSFILNYDFKYNFSKGAINGILDYNNINASGTSIQKEIRNLLATTLLFKNHPTDKFGYGINIRKDWVNDYKSPFVFAVDGKYAISKPFTLTFNGSKNFRIPTFNDLYWETGGNLELKPETSLQGEIGQSFNINGLKFQLTTFYIDTKDLIQWRPTTSGSWSPINVKNTKQYGLESSITLHKNINNRFLTSRTSYAFTKAIDKESGSQLMYVPKHKVTSNLVYNYKRSKIALEALYNGLVYSTTDESLAVDAYIITNLFLEYKLIKLNNKEVTGVFSVNNILNTKYQNVAYRPMPNRNFKLQLNFKF